MTLLALLARERAAGEDLEVIAAHFDHGSRGADGAEDARVVSAAADRWGAHSVLGSGDAPARARATRKGPMTAARDLRWSFLCDVAARESAWGVATAHQRDDRVETALLRIVRGASPDGLAGPRSRDRWRGIRVIRPLLPFPRAEIARWAELAGVPFREDPSNRDPRYPRSRIRAEVLPLLRELNPRVDEAVERLCDRAAVDAEAFAEQTAALLAAATVERDGREWILAGPRLANAPAALLGRALVTLWAWSAPPAGAPPGAEWVEGVARFVRAGRGGRVPAPGGGEIARRGPRLIVRRAGEAGDAGQEGTQA